MTDYSPLKKLAQAADDLASKHNLEDFEAAANPATVLKLIEELEETIAGFQVRESLSFQYLKERDEARGKAVEFRSRLFALAAAKGVSPEEFEKIDLSWESAEEKK